MGRCSLAGSCSWRYLKTSNNAPIVQAHTVANGDLEKQLTDLRGQKAAADEELRSAKSDLNCGHIKAAAFGIEMSEVRAKCSQVQQELEFSKQMVASISDAKDKAVQACLCVSTCCLVLHATPEDVCTSSYVTHGCAAQGVTHHQVRPVFVTFSST